MVKKKHKQDRSVEIVRWSILGTVGLIIAAFVIYAVLYTLGVFDSSEKYSTLADREIQTDHIEVVEFFSYDVSTVKDWNSAYSNLKQIFPKTLVFHEFTLHFLEYNA